MDYSKYTEPSEVLKIVNEVMGVDIMKNTRNRLYIDGRAIYYKILRDEMNLSYAFIGKSVNKSHATILHAIRNINFYVERDAYLRDIYTRCLRKLDLVAEKEVDTAYLEYKIDVIERRVGLWLNEKVTTRVIESITTELHNLGVLRKDILLLQNAKNTEVVGATVGIES